MNTAETDLVVILSATVGALHRVGVTDQAIREVVETAISAAGMSWEQLPEPVQATWMQAVEGIEKTYKAQP
jgi:hypothetical protein